MQVLPVSVGQGCQSQPVVTLNIIANNPSSDTPFQADGGRLAGLPIAEVVTSVLTGDVTHEALLSLLYQMSLYHKDKGHVSHKGLPMPRYKLPDGIGMDDDSVNQPACYRLFNGIM